jgi:hypothetical protein
MELIGTDTLMYSARRGNEFSGAEVGQSSRRWPTLAGFGVSRRLFLAGDYVMISNNHY